MAQSRQNTPSTSSQESTATDKFHHWITKDNAIVAWLDQYKGTDIYAVAVDPATETHGEHMHILFFNKSGKEINALMRHIRHNCGCKGRPDTFDKDTKDVRESKTLCRNYKSGAYCKHCGFAIKTTRDIKSPLHARNCFDYIANKDSSYTNPDINYASGTEYEEIQHEFDYESDDESSNPEDDTHNQDEY